MLDLVTSIANQTYKGSFECIFMDDNSTDNSLNLLKKLSSELLETQAHISVSILHDGKNMKQGARRNQGIQKAKGEWLFFIDSDDQIHSETLSLCQKRIEKNRDADMVYFNYAFRNTLPNHSQNSSYAVVENSLYKRLNYDQLLGEECEKLLAFDTYFSVNKTYKKSFLIENDITFGEGYYYEDFEFYVKSAVKSEKIELLTNVLYYVRVHDNSTTSTNKNSNKHPEDVYKAISASVKSIKDMRLDISPYNAIKYFINRSLLYAETRSIYTDQEKVKFIHDVITVIQNAYPIEESTFPKNYLSKLYYSIFKIGYYQRNDAKNIVRIYKLYKYDSKKLNQIVTEHRKQPFKFKTRFNRKVRLLRANSLKPKEITTHIDVISDNVSIETQNTILMLGFDYKYTGNSKYLFDQLRDIYDSNTLKFTYQNLPLEYDKEEVAELINQGEDITIDPLVHDDQTFPYLVKPRSDEFYEWIDKSKIIIAESWVPLDFELRDDQKLIQLWHGHPFKKMLFDSTELSVLEWNAGHKRSKSIDINRWTYLLSETEYSDEKFRTSLSIENDNLIKGIYPRNKWMLDNKDNVSLKNCLREKYGIPADKKIILYLPTWRDYNFKQKQFLVNDGYMINYDRLNNALEKPEEYIFITKGHALDKANNSNDNTVIIDNSEDIQPYFLIADIVISDYSSAIFDALALDIPFYLLFKDIDYYTRIRGIYDDAVEDFSEVIAYSELELAKLIQDNNFKIKNHDRYLIKTDYEIKDLIASILEKNK